MGSGMTEPPSLFLLHPFDLLVWCVGPLGTAMRVRVLHAKHLHAYVLPGSTARQLFNSSTLLDSLTARQLLDSSTDLDSYSTPRRMESASTSLDRLDRNSTGSTGSTGKASTAPVDSASTQCLDGASEPRQLWTAHGSTARARQRAPSSRVSAPVYTKVSSERFREKFDRVYTFRH